MAVRWVIINIASMRGWQHHFIWVAFIRLAEIGHVKVAKLFFI